ncbi:MAG: permease-like cell division protein FtsX [Bacteroidota bacterium]
MSGFTRTKLSTALSVITIALSLLLLGAFAILTINASRFVEELRNRVELEAFLEEPPAREQTEALGGAITRIEGVERVQYVSQEEAARIFREEFGEEINVEVFPDFNPLPASFKVRLKDGYKTSREAARIQAVLDSLPGVDRVIYRKEFLELIDARTASAHMLALGLGVLVSLSAIFLVSNTIRLAIYAKRQIIRTMELVGATGSFIRMPFLLEGLIQGLLGGIAASAVLYALLEYAAPLVSADFASFIRMQPGFYLILAAAGMGLGLLGSIISVARFIRIARRAG